MAQTLESLKAGKPHSSSARKLGSLSTAKCGMRNGQLLGHPRSHASFCDPAPLALVSPVCLCNICTLVIR
jgi:hypothetical protein